MPDDILYRIMDYVRRINYTTLESSREEATSGLSELPGIFLFTDIFGYGDKCSSIKIAECCWNPTLFGNRAPIERILVLRKEMHFDNETILSFDQCMLIMHLNVRR